MSAGALTALAAACAPSSPPPAASPRADQPRPGGLFRWGIVGDALTLDGHSINAPLNITMQLHDRLTQYDAQFVPQPMLAESFDVSSDRTQLKLSLRKGVTFHTGRELTADDIKWNIARIAQDPKLNSLIYPQAAWWTAMDAPDKYTLVLKSDAPRPPTVFDLFEFLTIIDPQSDDLNAHPSGTGPFQLVEWAPGDHFKLTKNRNYWQADRPYFDDLYVQIFGDPQAMIVALEATGIDAADKPPTRDELRLRGDSNFQLVANDMSAAYYCMSMNTSVPPLDNKLVRQALSYATDRKRMVDTALPGLGQPKFLPWPSHSPAYEADKDAAYPFDLDKARDLLQQAGISNAELELLYSAQFAEYPTMAQIYQSDLAKLGIALKLRPIDNGAFLAEKLAGHFQLTLDRNTSTSLNPDRGISGGFLGKANVQKFADPAYLSLIDQVLAESDAEKRKPLLSRFNDILVDEAFVPSLCSVPTAALASGRVRGLVYSAAENWKIGDMWLAA